MVNNGKTSSRTENRFWTRICDLRIPVSKIAGRWYVWSCAGNCIAAIAYTVFMFLFLLLLSNRWHQTSDWGLSWLIVFWFDDRCALLLFWIENLWSWWRFSSEISVSLIWQRRYYVIADQHTFSADPDGPSASKRPRHQDDPRDETPHVDDEVNQFPRRFCPKCFVNDKVRTRHEILHLASNAIYCVVCGKVTNCEFALRDHMLSHKGKTTTNEDTAWNRSRMQKLATTTKKPTSKIRNSLAPGAVRNLTGRHRASDTWTTMSARSRTLKTPSVDAERMKGKLKCHKNTVMLVVWRVRRLMLNVVFVIVVFEFIFQKTLNEEKNNLCNSNIDGYLEQINCLIHIGIQIGVMPAHHKSWQY